jgi:hypothetical protein
VAGRDARCRGRAVRWWERIPKLAGPLAMALAGMEPDVRDAIAQRAKGAAAKIAERDGDELVIPGSVLIAGGRKPGS